MFSKLLRMLAIRRNRPIRGPANPDYWRRRHAALSPERREKTRDQFERVMKEITQ